MKNTINKAKNWVLRGGVVALASGAAALADDAPGVTTITALSTNITALSTAGFTVLGVLLAATIGMKLVKKFAGKCT